MKFYIQQLLRNKLINTRKGKPDKKTCNDFNSSITSYKRLYTKGE